jgi:hypothetical protein
MGKLVERMNFGPDGVTAEVPEALRRKAEIEARKAMIAAGEKREAKRRAEAAKRQETAQAEAREALRQAMERDPTWSGRLAAHEGGHCLHYVLEGLKPGPVGFRLNESGRLEGFAAGAKGYLSPSGCLAGAGGERLLCGDGDPAGSDLEDFRKLCRAQGWSPEARLESDLGQVVERLRPELRALKRLRDEILVRGTLTGTGAERILLDAMTFSGKEEVQRARQRTGWMK